MTEDEQTTHCTHCGAVEEPHHGIKLHSQSDDDGYSEVVCNMCLMDFDDSGTPHPEPWNECRICGSRRDSKSTNLFIEILEPFSEALYICEDCNNEGRGMK